MCWNGKKGIGIDMTNTYFNYNIYNVIVNT